MLTIPILFTPKSYLIDQQAAFFITPEVLGAKERTDGWLVVSLCQFRVSGYRGKQKIRDTSADNHFC